MPERLRYSCRWPTCPNRVRRSGFCPEHGGSRRVTTGNYAGSWPGIRAQQLQREPTCRACGRPATAVDHIRRLTPVHPGDQPGTHDPSNLASTCTDCIDANPPPRRESDSDRAGEGQIASAGKQDASHRHAHATALFGRFVTPQVSDRIRSNPLPAP
jgi:hypothetical protein